MSDIKVGDKVRVKDASDSSICDVGDTGMVTEICDDSYTKYVRIRWDHSSKYQDQKWFPHRFEKVPVEAPQTYHGFKVGDKVEFKASKGYSAQPGATATVIDPNTLLRHTNPEYLYVKWDRDNGLSDYQMDGGYIPKDFIPHIPKPTPSPLEQLRASDEKVYVVYRAGVPYATSPRTFGEAESSILCQPPGPKWTIHKLTPVASVKPSVVTELL